MKRMMMFACGIAFFVVLFLIANRWYAASTKEWNLLNRIPTSSIKESKHYGVFETALRCEPSQLTINQIGYRIEAAWLEHRADPIRISPFAVQQKNSPELILCMRLRIAEESLSNKAVVCIATQKSHRVYGPPFRENMCIDVGTEVPLNIVLSSSVDDPGVQVSLEAADPTGSGR